MHLSTAFVHHSGKGAEGSHRYRDECADDAFCPAVVAVDAFGSIQSTKKHVSPSSVYERHVKGKSSRGKDLSPLWINLVTKSSRRRGPALAFVPLVEDGGYIDD